MIAKAWGVWGGQRPGGWCLVAWQTSMRYAGTREEAEATCVMLQGENPSCTYEVVVYDPEREPEARPKGVTAEQIACLREVAARPQGVHEGNPGCLVATSYGSPTFRALLQKGLVRMSGETRNLVATKAGKALLEPPKKVAPVVPPKKVIRGRSSSR